MEPVLVTQLYVCRINQNEAVNSVKLCVTHLTNFKCKM